jgi:hypothetical protein
MGKRDDNFIIMLNIDKVFLSDELDIVPSLEREMPSEEVAA